ncbi:MAG: arginine N-succinyltransferase [Sphingomonadales bacterium]|nr:arginine N-succinyltransferase [Sphingomonadales bacterium]MDE2169792.1 arginine N-succinyltransferase [Sphingomonadales bacterium]
MSFVLRSARPDDVQAIYEMAKITGGGFTNLPADRAKLEAKLEGAALAFGRSDDMLGEDIFVFVLEDMATGRVRGTCQIFSKIGMTWPHYSFRLDSFTHYSREIDRAIRVEMLTFVTDHNGCSEVGGLFLHPSERAGGAGALLARSRYLFMRRHRARFADRTLAELRGVIDDAGRAPFWDGVLGRFFGMSFQEADGIKSVRGLQFIGDLMPKHPIYTAMIPDTAMAVLGVPHPSGRAAMRMLEKEGFTYERYVDVLDGGPTMTVATDRITTLCDAREDQVLELFEGAGGDEALIATGRLGAFRATYGRVRAMEGGIALDVAAGRALGLCAGETVTHVAR